MQSLQNTLAKVRYREPKDHISYPFFILPQTSPPILLVRFQSLSNFRFVSKNRELWIDSGGCLFFKIEPVYIS
jgi:hypothetical protein